jgi:cytochrome c-type biogenesis protein CcsB
MAGFEAVFMWVAIAAYAVATIFAIAGLVFVRERWEAVGYWSALAGFVFHTASVMVRWVESGRLPVARDYENAISGSWAIMIGLLVLMSLGRRFRWSAAMVLPLVLLTLGFGITSPSGIEPLTPAYRSGWLVIHVTFAWITYACYSAAAGIAALVLLRASGRTQFAKLQARLPESDEAEDLMTRLVALGFLMNGVMIASGSIWAYRLWGAYWSWDPVETWSLITWLAYALYLHLKLIVGWKGAWLAWLVVFSLFGVMMMFWGVQLFPSSYHLFRSIGEVQPQVRP